MIAKSLAVVTTLLTLATGGRAQDALPLSRTDRSIIPTQDQPEVQSSGFKKADHITGDWGAGLMRRYCRL